MNKTIHYFWFGGNPKSKLIEKCIASWRRYFPDFEIKEWNEENFDIRQNEYISQAYDAKKYAFVSDFARFKVLYDEGGLYFDTDVEVVRAFSGLLEKEAFSGFETENHINPGLVLWAKEPGNEIIKQMLDSYETDCFVNPDGTFNDITVCIRFTGILENYGIKPDDGTVQTCGSFTLYPREYFCPLNDLTGVMNKTENTCAIHWFAKSWIDKKIVYRSKITRIIHRYFGVDALARFRK